MASKRTLSIIKPDATERNITGLIIARLEAAGLRVIAQKRVWWTKKEAKKFYEVHKDQPFYKGLIVFMTSGPIVLQVLEGDNAIAKNREVMGSTNPVDAAPGSIRKDFGVNLQRNSVHGSDSPETAKREISLCFKKSEIVG
jgi:nucleoside-diphosphate kinase